MSCAVCSGVRPSAKADIPIFCAKRCSGRAFSRWPCSVAFAICLFKNFKAVTNLDSHATKALVDKLAPDAPASLAVLRDRAKKLEHEAAQLRLLAERVHQERVLVELAEVVKGKGYASYYIRRAG